MNPFSFGTVVREPYFFDRKEEIKRIINTLKGGNNLVLYAPRRYGKTSLVMKSIEELEGHDYTCVYFDFMAVYSRDSFSESFTKAVIAKQDNWKKALQSMANFVKSLKSSLTFDEQGNPELILNFSESRISDKTLTEIIDLPEKMADKTHPYIIVMDEFQAIVKLNGENFENLLPSRMQHHQHVNYLFLGSQTHLLNDMFTNKNRPFYNSASTMSIGALPESETIAFLRERFAVNSINIDEETARYLIVKAGRIPYYIQLLAAEVWQYTVDSTKYVEVKTINQCADQILHLKSDYYFELFDRQSAYQKKLLKALAISGQNVFSNDYTKRFRLSAPSSTQKAIQHLLNEGIIEKSQHEYTYSDPFFKAFILRFQA